MKIISFAKTTPALLAGRKTVTRREWKDSYAESFNEGDELQAWDRLPRTGLGKRVGTIRLTCKPVKQTTAGLYISEYKKEGFAYLTAMGETWPDKLWLEWRHNPRALWVVRFELVEPQPIQ